jgi:ankyrin repeat protein
MTAAFWGTPEDLAPILARGANLEARTKHGFTPLMFASGNYAPTAKFLLEQGANLYAEDIQGDIALTFIIKFGRMNHSMFHTLIEAGINLKDTDKSGRTPLTQIPAGNYNYIAHSPENQIQLPL